MEWTGLGHLQVGSYIPKESPSRDTLMFIAGFAICTGCFLEACGLHSQTQQLLGGFQRIPKYENTLTLGSALE